MASHPPYASALSFIAASTTAAVTMPEPDTSWVLVWVPLGVIAGTVWRMQFWYVKDQYQPSVMRADAASIFALVMLGLGAAAYFSWDGPLLGAASCLGALVGVDPFRKAFQRVIDTWWPPGMGPPPHVTVLPPSEPPP